MDERQARPGLCSMEDYMSSLYDFNESFDACVPACMVISFAAEMYASRLPGKVGYPVSSKSVPKLFLTIVSQ